MDVLVAFENSFSRDFAQHHLARSDPEMKIVTANSLEQALSLANRADRLGAAALVWQFRRVAQISPVPLPSDVPALAMPVEQCEGENATGDDKATPTTPAH